MSRDINNLKEIANSILKDIQVTEDLKLSTLKKCKEQKKYNLKPFFVTVASLTIIIFSIASYKFIFHKPNSSFVTYNNEIPKKSAKLNNENNKYTNNKNDVNINNSNETVLKKQIQQNSRSTVNNNSSTQNIDLPSNNSSTQNIDLPSNNSSAQNADLPSNNSGAQNVHLPNSNSSTQNIDLPNSNSSTPSTSSKDKPKDNTTNSPSPENKQATDSSGTAELNDNTNTAEDAKQNASANISAKSSIDSDTPMLKSSLSESSKPVSIADAENFWGGKLIMPSYIPDGFELTDISLPKNDSREIYVKLNYSFKNIYFKILQNKSTTFTNYTGKFIDINGSKGYITKTKDPSDPSIMTTEINFVKNNIQYDITGNIQEDELIKITKSMN
ncbi:DUF4367 domain-containing protein [Clostridiaceae bacterium UIB06]|uniref:DUF4367 domain-containing protein n=1 Tax=Clostridium thailandense TaxID=2794346 RepID=A0A949TXY1_9CLOT|nr:DUF4367 domain-containing protein [Clostridium thailandense]MBV7273625.1 DUF4367 domain-containing protein [Clostridium thailandense]MCH5136301.1 DUF4367 domain-containing protein [Clostridiaceae bacterium UIB06]